MELPQQQKKLSDKSIRSLSARVTLLQKKKKNLFDMTKKKKKKKDDSGRKKHNKMCFLL